MLFESLTGSQFDQLRRLLAGLVEGGDRGLRLASSMQDWFAAGGAPASPLPLPRITAAAGKGMAR